MSGRSTSDRLTEATPFDREQTRMFAELVLAEHDPKTQDHPGDRCDLCNRSDIVEHPCDPFDLAAYVVMLLDAAAETEGGEK